MKSLIALSITLLVSTAGAAENLYCVFTEPFINITLDGTTKEILENGMDNYDEATGDFIPKSLGKGQLVRVGDIYAYPSQFELRDEKDQAIVKLVFDSAGSDGMSDNTYPISAEYTGVASLFGGCYTESAKPWNPYEIELSLGIEAP